MGEYRIATEIHMDASRELVWQVLTDFARYGEWNPFIPWAEGTAREGERIRIKVQPAGKGGMVFRPRVLRCAEARELRWLGHLGVPGLFDGEHGFELEDGPDGGCRLRHTELFRGLLVPLFRKGLEGETTQGFHAMNAALKMRAETGHA